MSILEEKGNERIIELLYKALNSSQDGFAIWRGIRTQNNEFSDFELVFINQAGAAPTGENPRNLVGGRISQIIPGVEAERLKKAFVEALDSSQVQTETINVQTMAGWIGSFENSVTPLTDVEVLATYRDVSKFRAESARMKWLSEHDSLTGLANRQLLMRVVEEAIEGLRQSGEIFAVGLIDMDEFKGYNDTYGHQFGDSVLKHFANQLQYSLRGRDVIARLGGDEFAVILFNVRDENGIIKMNNRFREILKQNSIIEEIEINTRFSAGFVLVESGLTNANEILKLADRLMYIVKTSGKNNFRIEKI